MIKKNYSEKDQMDFCVVKKKKKKVKHFKCFIGCIEEKYLEWNF